MNVYLTTEPCPMCGAAADQDCDPGCVLMKDPGEWFDDLGISDADPGL